MAIDKKSITLQESIIRSEWKKQDMLKNLPLVKKSTVLSNPYETWTIIVDCLQMAKFLNMSCFFTQTL